MKREKRKEKSEGLGRPKCAREPVSGWMDNASWRKPNTSNTLETSRGPLKVEELVCIVCPVGCSLVVEEGAVAADGLPALTVTGNRCSRGAAYAREEVQAPKRTVTATCAISGSDKGRDLYALRRVPVKTNIPCPKEKIPALLTDIYHVHINVPIKAGDTVIANWQNSGIDVVATRSVT